jgi:hypothetical protein
LRAAPHNSAQIVEEEQMTPLSALWLPILLSAVFVFVASSIIHMAPLWHKNDFPKMPQEEAVLAALRPLAIPPGDYMIPRPGGREEMRSAAFQEKLKQGPVMVATVMPNGMFSMGRNLGLWFVYLVVVELFAAGIASRGVAPGATFQRAFRFTGAVSFVGYVLALWQLTIWYRRSFSIAVKDTIDGIIYAAIAGATFGWLWPR